MSDKSDAMKEFSRRVARSILTADGGEALHLLQLTGLMGEVDGLGAAPRGDDGDPETSGSVGIWDRKEEDGEVYFARRVEDIDNWNFWANIGRIEASTDKRRVVYLGESVARGFLYDPQFTPARALEQILEGQLGEGQVEVVDLARTNMALEIRDLALQALQLDPDVLVVFAGNNWTVPFPLALDDLPPLDSVLREEGLAGADRFIAQLLGNAVEKVVRDVSTRYRERGVPVIWICPEFNLGDWRDPEANAPILGPEASRRWLELRDRAEQALAEDDPDGAEELAREMGDLDGGLTNTVHYLMAEIHRRRGDRAGEREALEAARDTLPWVPSRTTSPRTQAVSRRTLHRVAEELGDRVLDAPDLYREYLDGDIPGRRLFIDYCHLTSEGILLTMAAAAEAILGALGEDAPPWRDLLDPDLAPAPEVEAEASFLASVHNGHWWQSYDLVRHYCQRAVEHSPEIREVMTRFIDLQSRKTPMLMCKAAQEIVELGSPLIQHYLLRYNNQQLDRRLIDAVVDALATVGVDARPTVEMLRRDEHGLDGGPTDLLSYYYNSAAYQPQEVRWAVPARAGLPRPDTEYYQAFWRESRFVFVGRRGQEALLRLTCRLPAHAEAPDRVRLRLNGTELGELEVGHGWQSWEIPVAGEALVDDLNEITLDWPVSGFPDRQDLHSVVRNLAAGQFPSFYPSFGEIHTFTVEATEAASTAA